MRIGAGNVNIIILAFFFIFFFDFFFFNDTATTEIYTLSLHDALPICKEDISGALDWDVLMGSLI